MLVSEPFRYCTRLVNGSECRCMHSVGHRMTALGGPGPELPAAANPQPTPPSPKPRLIEPIVVLLLAAAFSVASGWRANAQSTPHLSVAQPGGMPGWPVMTGITRVTNGVSVTWDGPSGYYQLFQKPSVTAPTWQAIGTPFNLARSAVVTNYVDHNCIL